MVVPLCIVVCVCVCGCVCVCVRERERERERERDCAREPEGRIISLRLLSEVSRGRNP